MNFFQRHRGKQEKETEPPAAEPPPLPKEERAEPVDAFEPIHIDDAQYCLLTRALRPPVAPVLKGLPADVPGSDVSAGAGGTTQPIPANPLGVAPDQPPGTPIV